MAKIETVPMGCAAGILVAGLLLAVAPVAAQAAEEAAGEAGEHYQIPRQKWTFGGIFGYFDRQQLRRGYKVYKEVCSNCHNLGLLSYRNLGEPGGPQFSPGTVKAIAAEAEVSAGPDEQGNIAMRPGRPSDNFQWTFKNEKEAAAALGAVPPDLSLMTRARGIEREFAWYAFPLIMLQDLATQYQEQGADYIYALLNGYSEPPAGKKIAEGLHYNRVFPGNQLAMPPQLLRSARKTRAVTAFLAWAAEPHLAERKRMGLEVMICLSVLAGLLLLCKKTLWWNIEH